MPGSHPAGGFGDAALPCRDGAVGVAGLGGAHGCEFVAELGDLFRCQLGLGGQAEAERHDAAENDQ